MAYEQINHQPCKSLDLSSFCSPCLKLQGLFKAKTRQASLYSAALVRVFCFVFFCFLEAEVNLISQNSSTTQILSSLSVQSIRKLPRSPRGRKSDFGLLVMLCLLRIPSKTVKGQGQENLWPERRGVVLHVNCLLWVRKAVVTPLLPTNLQKIKTATSGSWQWVVPNPSSSERGWEWIMRTECWEALNMYSSS